MSEPEFSRLVNVSQAAGKQLHLTAGEAECARLAARFGLVRIARLEADVALDREGNSVSASGRLSAELVQSCAVSGEDLPVTVDEPVAFRFVPASDAAPPDGELELDGEDCDEIEYTGTRFDLGEAVAQSLALAIDPFATGPEAERARREAGLADEAASGPFAALAKLKKS